MVSFITFKYPLHSSDIVNINILAAINIIYPTQIAVFWTNSTTPLKTTLLYSLPSNLGLVFGEILLICFGTAIGHWKWTLTGSVFLMVFFGALLGMGTPDNRGMMMAFVFLSQMGFGWAQMLSITFIQVSNGNVSLSDFLLTITSVWCTAG
jgi:Fungal trichothecene efflux pump (TRI12)